MAPCRWTWASSVDSVFRRVPPIQIPGSEKCPLGEVMSRGFQRPVHPLHPSLRSDEGLAQPPPPVLEADTFRPVQELCPWCDSTALILLWFPGLLGSPPKLIACPSASEHCFTPLSSVVSVWGLTLRPPVHMGRVSTQNGSQGPSSSLLWGQLASRPAGGTVGFC